MHLQAVRSTVLHHPSYLTTNILDLIYDPDQDPEEKRAVRKNYRSLAKTVEGKDAANRLNFCLTTFNRKASQSQ